MKKTLLEIVQIILASTEDITINSIEDNELAQDIAKVVRDSYEFIATKADLPEHWSLFELTASGDADLPNIMYLPSNILALDWVKYDNREDGDTDAFFQEVKFMELKEFLEYTHQFDSDEDDVDQITFDIGSDTILFKCYNDRFPTYYTAADDYTLVFDAYNSEEGDSTLVKNKTQCYGKLSSTFTMDDDFIPDLDAEQFQLLINEAKAQAFVEKKQTQNPKAEQRARSLWISTARKKRAVGDPYGEFKNLPDYARRRP